MAVGTNSELWHDLCFKHMKCLKFIRAPSLYIYIIIQIHDDFILRWGKYKSDPFWLDCQKILMVQEWKISVQIEIENFYLNLI
jgi:hypothetical protein